jgi:predicted nucleic acid-binding protein
VTTHLAETSVLTRLSVAPVRGALQPFIDAVALARCTLTDLELGFSASSATDWDRLQSVLTALTPVEVTPAVIGRAKNVQRMLAAGGLKGRKVPDLIIAAAAELADLTVLHYDQDFELIASVTRQPHEWIVPRGSIDLHHECLDEPLRLTTRLPGERALQQEFGLASSPSAKPFTSSAMRDSSASCPARGQGPPNVCNLPLHQDHQVGTVIMGSAYAAANDVGSSSNPRRSGAAVT